MNPDMHNIYDMMIDHNEVWFIYAGMYKGMWLISNNFLGWVSPGNA